VLFVLLNHPPAGLPAAVQGLLCTCHSALHAQHELGAGDQRGLSFGPDISDGQGQEGGRRCWASSS
jgi:hypothetical protein